MSEFSNSSFKEKHILLTGSSGLIGKYLLNKLNKNNLNKVTNVARSEIKSQNKFSLDLTSRKNVKDFIESIDPIDVIIHCAAIAHGQNISSGMNISQINSLMVNNLISCFGESQPHWIFMSSVSVYGNAYTNYPMEITLKPKPVDDYGFGKLNDENLLLSKCKNLDILRLPPVYNDENLDDIKKRVFIPIINKKILITPAPLYTLCHTSKIFDVVKTCLSNSGQGRQIIHLGNSEPINQNKLSEWFDGKGIWVPQIIFLLIFYVLPKRFYFFKSIAYMLKKLGLNNTFKIQKKNID